MYRSISNSVSAILMGDFALAGTSPEGAVYGALPEILSFVRQLMVLFWHGGTP